MSETTTTTTEATVAEKGAKGATKRVAGSKEASPKKGAPTAKKAAKKHPAAKSAKPHAKANGKRDGSKSAAVLELLRRPKGATLAELMSATQWQAHSVRGFLSGAVGRKMGLTVESTRRDDGERLYKLTK